MRSKLHPNLFNCFCVPAHQVAKRPKHIIIIIGLKFNLEQGISLNIRKLNGKFTVI